MRNIQKIWGIAAAVFVLAGLALCALGLRRGPLLVKTDQDPGRAVAEFFEELSRGETEAAYARLGNYKSLGLENVPRSEDGALLLSALQKSYSCHLLREAERRGDTACQPIRLRFLDLDALEAKVASGEAADIREALQGAGALTAAVELTATLRYDGESWKLMLSRELLDAIQGHIPGEGSV